MPHEDRRIQNEFQPCLNINLSLVCIIDFLIGIICDSDFNGIARTKQYQVTS